MNVTIRVKLLFTFAVVLMLNAAVNLFALKEMQNLAALTTNIHDHPLQVTRAVLSAHISIIKMHSSMKNAVLAPDDDTAAIDVAQAAIAQQEELVYQQLGIVQEWILGSEGRALIQQTLDVFSHWQSIRNEITALMRTGQRKQAIYMIQEKDAHHVALLERQINKLRDYAADKAAGMYANAQYRRDNIFMSMLVVFAVVTALSAFLGFMFARSLANAMHLLSTVSQRLSAGDMQLHNVDPVEFGRLSLRRDELGDIGREFDAMVRYFQTVIQDLVNLCNGIARGDLKIAPQAEYRGDFAQIKQALSAALHHQRNVVEDIVALSKGLAEGDLSVSPQAEYMGDFHQINQAINIAITDLRCVIEDIVNQSDNMARGNWQSHAQAEYRGEFLRVYQALSAANQQLASTSAENADQDWLKTGQTQLNEQIRGEQNINSLAEHIIRFLSRYLEAQVGMFYYLDGNDKQARTPQLHLLASYAYQQRKDLKNSFQLGEGLVGQAALEQQTLLIKDVPSDYLLVQSGLGNANPAHLLVASFAFEEQVKGVLELGKLHAFTSLQVEFVHQVLQTIAIALNTAESRAAVQELLEQAQSQAEELQSQQEELRQTNEELGARTQELEEQKEDIRSKNKVLEAARRTVEEKARELELVSKYKSEFLANMSHELRTPLNSLLILSKMLMDNSDNNLNDKQIKWASTIHSAGSDLLSLINDILDLSKVEAGKIELSIDNVLLSALVENLEQKFQPIALDKSLQFNISIYPDVPPNLYTDMQRLQQILGNLLSNALKFTLANGHVTLQIQALPAEQIPLADPANAPHYIAFSVIDDGIGIPKDKQKTIFSAFHQADGTTSRRYGGTGLGLSISRQFTTLLGGELHLQSEPDKGSTFTLYLPIRSEMGVITTPKTGTSDTPIVSIRTIGESTLTQSVQITVPNTFNWSDFTAEQIKRLCQYCKRGDILGMREYLEQVCRDSSNPSLDHVRKLANNFEIRTIHKLFEQSPACESNKRATNTGTEQTVNIVTSNKVTSPPPKPTNSNATLLVDDRDKLQDGDNVLLIIENDVKCAQMLLEAAHERYLRCLVARDGKQGLVDAQQYHPNAIMLNLHLPLLDGWSVMETLKNDTSTRHIPIYVMSTGEDPHIAQTMGAIGFLNKPANMRELNAAFQHITHFIDRHSRDALVVADDTVHKNKICRVIEHDNLNIHSSKSVDEVLQQLQTKRFDCLVIDWRVERGAWLLEQLLEWATPPLTPIVVYNVNDFDMDEEALLHRCRTKLTLKAVHSPERLLDEATLFLHQAETHLLAEQQRILRTVHNKQALLQDKKILLVDDDTRNIFSMSAVLEDKGMTVLVATDGKQGIAQLHNNPDTDLVLMDIMMPEMDGYEAIRAIRNEPTLGKIPIIALTAKAMRGDKAKCIEAGANDYLAKPIDSEKLISLLRVWLYK